MKKVLAITKEWLIPLLGIILAVQANSEMNRAEELQRLAQKTIFGVTLRKVAIDAPTEEEFSHLSKDELLKVLNTSYSDISSQLGNEYLISNETCHSSWESFEEFLFMAGQFPGSFEAMGPGHDIAKNYRSKLSSVLNDCWEL
jgi:hypothetical protein